MTDDNSGSGNDDNSGSMTDDNSGSGNDDNSGSMTDDNSGSEDGDARRLELLEPTDTSTALSSECHLAVEACKADAGRSGCNSIGEIIKEFAKDWDKVKFPLGVPCTNPTNGYPLIKYAESQLKGKSLMVEDTVWTNFYRDNKKWTMNKYALSNSTVYKLAQVYDNCFGEFATNEFTYLMRLSGGDRILNENYMKAEGLHCRNPFVDSMEASAKSSGGGSFTKKSAIDINVMLNEPTRLVEQYYTCTEKKRENPGAVLGSSITLASVFAASITSALVILITKYYLFIKKDKAVACEFTDNEMTVMSRVIALKELERIGGLNGRKGEVGDVAKKAGLGKVVGYVTDLDGTQRRANLMERSGELMPPMRVRLNTEDAEGGRGAATPPKLEEASNPLQQKRESSNTKLPGGGEIALSSMGGAGKETHL
ncbi:hypothetical protein TrST_g4312 [Triparma strigata]|uniref:Uncharacterized protein n=1 Tax=Triparma strigata TaxID=1606541 RepID=A0A9W7ARA5_9STRA|nr:hypothetical protein TrST_g4312 [Triparma strigata]